MNIGTLIPIKNILTTTTIEKSQFSQYFKSFWKNHSSKVSFFEKHEYFKPYQHGYVKGKSKTTSVRIWKRKN